MFPEMFFTFVFSVSGLRQMQHAETDDEGIERDSGDSEDDLNLYTSLDQVLQV